MSKSKSAKVIGEVIALTGRYHGQFIVNLYCHPSGRRLANNTTYLLTDHGAPFASKVDALDHLAAYRRGELVLGTVPPERIADAPTPVTQQRLAPTPAPKPERVRHPRTPKPGSAAAIRAALLAPYQPRIEREPEPAYVPPVVTKMPEPSSTGRGASAAKAAQKAKLDAEIAKARKNGVRTIAYPDAKARGTGRPRKVRAIGHSYAPF